jgi:hypothetical protein
MGGTKKRKRGMKMQIRGDQIKKNRLNETYIYFHVIVNKKRYIVVSLSLNYKILLFQSISSVFLEVLFFSNPSCIFTFLFSASKFCKTHPQIRNVDVAIVFFNTIKHK